MPGKKKTEETISNTTASPAEKPRPVETNPEPSAELATVKRRAKPAPQEKATRRKSVTLPSDSAPAPAEPETPAEAKPAAAALKQAPKRRKAAEQPAEESPAPALAPTPAPVPASDEASEGRPKRLFGKSKPAAAPAASAEPAAEQPKAEAPPVVEEPAPVQAAAPSPEPASPPAPAKKALFGRTKTQAPPAAPAASPAAEPKPHLAEPKPQAAEPKPQPAEPRAVEAKPVQAPKPEAAQPKADPAKPNRLFGRREQAEKGAAAPAQPVASAPEAAAEPTDAPAQAAPEGTGGLSAVFRKRPDQGRPKAKAPEAEPASPAAPEAPPVLLPPTTLADVEDGAGAGSGLTFSMRTPGQRPAVAESKDDEDDDAAQPQASEPASPSTLAVGAWRAPEDAEADRAGRSRRRRRRRGGRPEDDDVETAASDDLTDDAEAPIEPAPEPVAAPKAAPKPETRPRLSVPVDAPQVVMRDGVTLLVRERKVLPPLVFFGAPDAHGSRAQLLEQVRESAEQGVHLYSLPVDLEGSDEEPDAALHQARSLMTAVAEIDSDALFVLRLNLSPPDDWHARWPGSRWRAKGSEFPEPSIADDGFWEMLKATVAGFVRQVGSGPVGARMVGVHLERGGWHYVDDAGYDTSEAARSKFSKWLRQRYRDDVVSLRASWFDGKVSFENVAVPDYNQRHGKDTDFVRLDRRARRWVDYHLFLSDLIVERIADLAYSAKAASGANALVGVSYGSTFEWSHPGSGHLSLGKLLRCAEIDFIAGPPSYRGRQPGESAAFPWPIDSLVLNGKLALSEEDYRTPIGRSDDEETPLMRTPQALESAHWRGTGAVLAHGGGVMWMDSNGRGWLNSRGIWERGAKVRQALSWRASAPMQDPDVALFIDERSLAYLSDERAFGILVQNVRESILRSGMSVGFYLLSDLAHRESFPEARLYVFVNAWDIRPEVRSAIKSRLQRDNKVLFWLYSAGLFEGGRESLERAREVTGIALRPQPFNSKPGTTLVNLRDPLCRVLPEDMMAQGGTLEPSYFAIPEDAAVLGEYTQTGLASFVVRKFPTPGTSDEPWTSVFLGEPVVTPGLFRALGQMAGAHIYSLDDDVAHVRPPFLTLHCSGAGVRTITLPDKWSCFDLIQRVWMPVENSSLKFLGLDGATYSFLVGHKSEIEAILASTGPGTLSEAEILEHQDNTVKWESIQFDVPVMKLDEWVEESWSEELADDLLIKPSLIDDVESFETGESDPDETPRSSGKRRRAKRKGRERKGDPGQQAQEKAQTVNFLFRKRE